jgi:hypothetical protein
MDARSRKALGCSVLLVYLAAYVAGAATLGAMLLPVLPAWGELIFYVVAGIAWVAPLRPLFKWIARTP